MPRLRSQAPSPMVTRESLTTKKKPAKNKIALTVTQDAELVTATGKDFGNRVLANRLTKHAPKSSSSQETVADQKAVGDANFKVFCMRVFGSQTLADERLSRCSAAFQQKLRRVSDKVDEINDLHNDFVREADNSQRLESNVLPFTALRSVNFPHLADQLLLSSQVVDSIIDCTPPACSSTSSTATMDSNLDDDVSTIKTTGGKAKPPLTGKKSAVAGKKPPATSTSSSANRKTAGDYDSIVLAPDQFDELVAARLRVLSAMAPLEPTELIYSTTEPKRLNKRVRSQWTQNAAANDPDLLARVAQILRAKPPITPASGDSNVPRTDGHTSGSGTAPPTGKAAGSTPAKSKSTPVVLSKQKASVNSGNDSKKPNKVNSKTKPSAPSTLKKQLKKLATANRSETPPPSLSRKSIHKKSVTSGGNNMVKRPLFSPRRLRKRPS